MTTIEAAGAPLSAMSDVEVQRALTMWAGRLAAGEAVFVDLVGELDAREAWAGAGILSAAHWLSWRCALGSNAARERVRVARALRTLPATRAAFAAATLSFSQVRALTRVATPDNEQTLIDCARHATAGQLERLVRGMRRAIAADDLAKAKTVYDDRRLNYHWDEDGSLVIDRSRLTSEQGAIFVKAMDAAIDELRSDLPPYDPAGVTAVTPSGPALRADALVLIAERTLADKQPNASDPDTYRVVVRVDAETLLDDTAGEHSAIDDGPAIVPETVRRLLCDTAVRAVTELADGTLLDLGHTARFPNRALRRAVKARDGCCQFPGCTRTTRLQAHHIKAWFRRGPTDLINLVLLCSHHHHLVHEGGFNLTRAADGQIVVRAPGGWLIPNAPPLLFATPDRLAAAHARAGIAVDSDTLPPDSISERIDIGYAVSVLLQAPPESDAA